MGPKNNSIAILALLVFCVSLTYSFYFHIKPSVDAKAYDRIAWNMATGQGYREDITAPLDKDGAILRVGPGYELFLAGVYLIFGHHYSVVWVINALLLAAAAVLMFFITKEIFGGEWRPLIGLIAAGLVGLSPDLITMSGMLMSEVLGIFLSCLTIYFFCRYLNQSPKSIVTVFILALFLALTALVRTPLILLVIPLVWLLWQRRLWRHLAVVGLVIIFIFTPWIVRNFFRYHTFIPTNLAYGIDLSVGNHSGATGELEVYPKNEQYLINYGYVLASKKLAREAMLFIVTHPVEFIKISLYRVSIYFSFARPSAFWFHLSGPSKLVTALLSVIYSILIFILGFIGLVWHRLSVSPNKVLNYLLFMLLMVPLAVVGLIVETRYRFLVYPFFAIFAALAVDYFFKKRGHWRAAVIVIIILFSNTAFDVIKNFSRIIEKLKGF